VAVLFALSLKRHTNSFVAVEKKDSFCTVLLQLKKISFPEIFAS